MNLTPRSDEPGRLVSEKGRLVYRSNLQQSEDSPPAEFIFFIGPLESEAETVVELRNSTSLLTQDLLKDVNIPGGCESAFALELGSRDDIVAKSHAVKGNPECESMATMVESACAAPYKNHYVVGRPDDRVGTAFFNRHIIVERVIAHRLLSISMIVAVVSVVAAGILLFGKLSDPGRIATRKAEFGQTKPQPNKATEAVVAADASTKSSEAQPAPSPRIENNEWPTDAVNQDNSTATVSGSIESIPAPGTTFPAAMLETTGNPKGLDSPKQPAEPSNASSKPDVTHRNEAIGGVSVPPSRAIVAPPSPSRSQVSSRRESAERPRDVGHLRREPQESVPSKKLAAIRARLLRERMNKWWEEANLDWRMNEDPSVTEDREARGKVAAARTLSEIDSIPETELLKIETSWKSENLLRGKKKKPEPTRAPSQMTDTGN